MMIKAALLVEDYAELMERNERNEKFMQFMKSARTKAKLYNHVFYLIMSWDCYYGDAYEILKEFCEDSCGDYISVDSDDNIVQQTYIGLIDVNIRIIESA